MAVRFNASGEHYTATLSQGAQTSYTICGWVKISVDRNTWSTAWALYHEDAGNSCVFETNSNGTSWECLFDNGNDQTLVAATVGSWYFLAVSVNGSTVNCYVKPLGGSISNSASATVAVTSLTATTFRLGDWPLLGEWLNGCVAGVKLWLGAALTQAELDTESTQLMPVRTADLTAAYPLDVAETTDYSGNGFTLSSVGTPTTEAGPTGVPLTTGPQTITGTAAVTPGGVSVTAAGLRITTGTASVALGGASVAVRPIQRGTASVALGALSVSATGNIVFPTPGQVYDLSAWHLTLPTEDPGPDTDAAQIDQPQLETYTDANFYTDSLGRMVHVAPVQGFTTSGASGATRNELRQHRKSDYANSAWNPNTTGRMQLTVTTYADATSITGGSAPRKEMIIGQIHGAGDSPIPLILAAEYHVATPRVRIFKNGPGFANAVTGITPDTPITYRIRVENARLKLWVVIGQVADLPPLSSPHFDWPISDFTDVTGWYFKAGGYNKTTISSGSTGAAIAKISFIEVLEPSDPDPSGHVTGTANLAPGGVDVVAFGRRVASGTASVSLGGVEVTAVGTVIPELVTATANLALGALSVAATGRVVPTIEGAANLPLAALSVTAVGTRVVSGASTVELGAVSVAVTGTQTVTGTAALSLGEVSVTAVGTVVAEVVTGSASIVLAGLAVTADGSRAATGTAVVTLPALAVIALGGKRRPKIHAGTPIVVSGPVGAPSRRTEPTATPQAVRGPTGAPAMN